jgi:ankyrin repeat protein
MNRLLVKRANKRRSDKRERKRAFMEASSNGDIATVKNLLKCVNIDGVDDRGDTALHLAVTRNNLEIAKLLLENKANVNKPNDGKLIPINIACIWGYSDMVKLLIEYGSKINTHEEIHWSPLYMAINTGNIEIVKLLIENGANTVSSDNKQSIIHMSCGNGYLETTKLLIEYGADIHALNCDGWSTLNLAAYHRHLDVVKLLFEKGCDINKSNNDGWTPLYSAAKRGNPEMVQFLIENGADIHKMSAIGDSALDIAVFKERFEIARILIENAAFINPRVMVMLERTVEGEKLLSFINRPWRPNTHKQFSVASRNRISTVIKLSLRDCQIGRLPKDILLFICTFLGARNIE